MLLDTLPWALFLTFIVAMLALDLGVFHREAHEVGRREALIWYGVWVSLAALFNVGVYLFRGTQAGLEWTTGYLIEQSLSVDNVFVFLLIFATFAVPAKYQHRVLFWGIVGVLIMRAILIAFAGILLSSLHWMVYVFGGFLILTGLKFLRADHEAPSLEKNRLVRLARRLFPVTEEYVGQSFFVWRDGRRYITPLFLVLLLVESTDLVFAVDSVPAIYAVTDDPFTVFTSNIFAVLGLRSLYFVLAGYLAGLRYLKPALAAILVFVGSKMLLVDVYKMPALASLTVIIAILAVALTASFLRQQRPSGGAPDAHGAGSPSAPAGTHVAGKTGTPRGGAARRDGAPNAGAHPEGEAQTPSAPHRATGSGMEKSPATRLRLGRRLARRLGLVTR